MRDRVISLLTRVTLRALSWLSLRQAQRLGAFCGALIWRWQGSAARITRTNLTACFSELSPSDVDTLARESLMATGRLGAEMGMVWHWPEHRWRSAVASVTGDELLDRAQRDNTGVLVLSPHFGNWEILNLYLGARFGLMVLYDPPRIKSLDKPLRRARMRTGGELVAAGAAGLRTFRTALGRGRVVGLLPDQVPKRSAGVYAPFFGRAVLTPTLPGRLMRKVRPLVVIATATRLPDGAGFAFDFKPFEMPPDAADETIAGALNAEIEQIARRHPAQYQWEYRRFKRPPPGTPRLYPKT